MIITSLKIDWIMRCPHICDFSLHGWKFYDSSKNDGKLSLSSIFWLIVIVVSISSAVYVMATNIQGKTFLKSRCHVRCHAVLIVQCFDDINYPKIKCCEGWSC